MLKKTIIAVSLLLIIVLSLYYRVILPSSWLQGETIRMSTVDAYYQTRFAQIINSSHYQIPDTDPYFSIASEASINKAVTPILWPALISFCADILKNFNIANPVDIASSYLPPIVAVISIIGVFAICAILFNAWAGLIAALIMASTGGEFMARSILGSADYHAFETSLLVWFIVFIISATKLQAQNKTLLSIIMAILTGLTVAAYEKAWYGGGYILLILTAAYIVYLVILSLRSETPSGSMFAITTTAISSSLLFYIILTSLTGTIIDITVEALTVICFLVIVVSTPTQALCVHKANKYIFPIICIGIIAIAAIGLYLFARLYYDRIVGYLTPLFIWNSESKTSEEIPMLLENNEFTLNALWGNFTASFYLCLIGIGMLIKKIIPAERTSVFNYALIIIGTFVMLLSTLAMRRFAYYLIIFIAILSGIVLYEVLKVGISYLKRNKKRMKWFDKVGDVLLLLILVGFIFVPNFLQAANFKYPAPGTLSSGWEESLLWLHNNSPEPFTDSNYYYANYSTNKLKPSYSVMSWWDYGYWISAIAHRVPVCNPGSPNRYEAAAFMTTSDILGAGKMLGSVKSRYIMIDYQMITGKFTAMPTYADAATIDIKTNSGLGENKHDYIGLYTIGTAYSNNNNGLQKVTFFYPDYYQSMAVRLFNFDGRAVKSPGCLVVIFTEKDNMRLITKIQDLPSYDQAIVYTKTLKLKDGESFSVCGMDPFISCIDLPALDDYRLVHQTKYGVELNFAKQIVVPEVKTFVYTGKL